MKSERIILSVSPDELQLIRSALNLVTAVNDNLKLTICDNRILTTWVSLKMKLAGATNPN